MTIKNPLLARKHEWQRKRILSHFTELASQVDKPILHMHKYVSECPQEFFSRNAFDVFHTCLEKVETDSVLHLEKFITEHFVAIDNAYLHAQEINALKWHDHLFAGDDDYKTLMRIDREVHPAYLRLVEAVYYPMLKLIAYFSRISRSKGTDALNLFNVIDELKDPSFAEIRRPYVHLMRNAIAHGGVTYQPNEIVYRDRGSKELILSSRQVVEKFDALLDVCNGLLVAYSVFVLSKTERSKFIPRNLLIEELQSETTTPYWETIGVLSSTIMDGRTQLVIYCAVSTIDNLKVEYSVLQTASAAERLAPGYDRYFVSMRGRNGVQGWAALDGKKLGEARKNDLDIEMYVKALDDFIPFFLPRITLPRFVHSFETLVNSYQANLPTYFSQMRAKASKPEIRVRNSSIHRNAWGAVLNSDVVVEIDGREIDEELIKENCRLIIRYAMRAARRELHWYSLVRYLPIGFAQVDVFCKAYRARRLDGFGLGQDLVGTIRLQRIRRIECPDIIGSTIENWKGYRLAWNRSWLERRAGS